MGLTNVVKCKNSLLNLLKCIYDSRYPHIRYDFKLSLCSLREKALTSLKSGNKVVALRHTRELKLASQSREKCTTLLNRVDEVIRALADADSSKQVCLLTKIQTCGSFNILVLKIYDVRVAPWLIK